MLASGLMLGLYAEGGIACALGFVALVPWLRAQDGARSVARVLLGGWLMCVALTASMFAWFGLSMGHYAEVGGAAGLALLLLLAPLFQPQVLAMALVRHLSRRRFGPVVGACTGAAAWVAAEWAWPKMLGDTLGHGLYPSVLLRQAADLAGATGLTVLLLLANEAVAAAWARRDDGLRALARPLLLAALVPVLLAGYGLGVPAEPLAAAPQRLRMGLVQSNIVDYERLRREKGAGEVVREVLDTHDAMSHDAVVRQQVQALLWSETVYPTTFGQPKSEAGAELDREILGLVNAAGVPLVFGTYERDDTGEYNVAAFVAPGSGLLGFYRKTRLFPFTEALPAWMDGPLARRWLPWAGAWRAGSGARVFPLRLADGREVPVLPLICLDDVDSGLAIDGARLGAALILTMSNDSWFTPYPQGARLHLAVAAFRSIETRLPQFRVTNNGYSALIDARGEVLAGSQHGQRTLVVGDLPVREPPRTLMVAWGDWVGRAGALVVLGVAVFGGWQRWCASRPAMAVPPAQEPMALLPVGMSVLTPAVRLLAAALRAMALAGMLWMGASVLAGDSPLASNTLAQLRAFVALVLVPLAVAWALLRATSARLTLEDGRLVLARGPRRSELPVGDVVAVQAWRVPLPAPGCSLRRRDGTAIGMAGVDAGALSAALGRAGATAPAAAPAWAVRYAQVALAARVGGWLQHPAARFGLLPLLLAIPAFRLHQHIAFGGGLGEYRMFGALAYAQGFALWWAAWAVGVSLVAAVLRLLVEGLTLAAVLLRPQQAPALRRTLDGLALALLYGGIPAWLALRAAG